ncbi:MAG: TIGR01459 family HAD-type hydrolase [Pseudomonadota bacterium]
MAVARAPIPVLETIAPLAGRADAWLLDIWGVLHDGAKPFAPAVAACERFRASGGHIVLLSNSPRPAPRVVAQLDGIGVARAAYDAIVSSGDATRLALAHRPGVSVLHVGPERDRPIFDGLDLTLAEADAAELVVCTGLADDERETPDDYAELLGRLAARDVPMICANPDLKVERAGRMIWCAGGVAAGYERLGGSVLYAGKPYPEVYRMAAERIAELHGAAVPSERLLAIGDGVATDILGAARAGIASVYIASAVHVGAGERLDDALLERLFPSPTGRPLAAMTGLRW